MELGENEINAVHALNVLQRNAMQQLGVEEISSNDEESSDWLHILVYIIYNLNVEFSDLLL